jgi:hypothetical protein
MLYSADALTQVRRALGIPRPRPLSVPAQAVYRVAYQLEISGLKAAAREEAARALSGLASALNYEKLRSDGCDRCTPAVGGLSCGARVGPSPLYTIIRCTRSARNSCNI